MRIDTIKDIRCASKRSSTGCVLPSRGLFGVDASRAIRRGTGILFELGFIIMPTQDGVRLLSVGNISNINPNA